MPSFRATLLPTAGMCGAGLEDRYRFHLEHQDGIRRNLVAGSATSVAEVRRADELSFSADNKNWGYQLRLGLFEIERRDMRRIARAMNASVLPVEELLVARVA